MRHRTTDEVMQLRREAGWSTPLKPMEPGDPPVCWFATRGNYEFSTHPADLPHFVEHGITIDGATLKVTVVQEWPLMNAVLFAASNPAANTRYINPAEAVR